MLMALSHRSIFPQVLDYVNPLAWHAGQPFSIAAESSVDGLAHLAMAFMDGSPIVLDDMLELTEMACEWHYLRCFIRLLLCKYLMLKMYSFSKHVM